MVHICTPLAPSATGNANRTKPEQGFDDPELGKVFSSIATSVNTTTDTTLFPTVSTNGNLQSRPPAGAIAGGVVGGLVLLIAFFFILRRRQRMAAVPQILPDMASAGPQELEERGLHELHDPGTISELPSLPAELCGSVPEENRPSELDCGHLGAMKEEHDEIKEGY